MNIQDLPIDLFRLIITYATPEEASDLDQDTFKPGQSTLHLQLVCRLFCHETKRLLYHVRPLTIKLFRPDIQRSMTQTRLPSPLQLGDIMRDRTLSRSAYSDCNAHICSLKAVPFHRFKQLHIRLIPLLIPVNVPAIRDVDYFPSGGHEFADYRGFPTGIYGSLQREQRHYFTHLLRDLKDRLWIIYHQCSNKQSPPPLSVHVYYHDDPSEILSSYQKSNFLIPRAPILQLQNVPSKATHLLSLLSSLGLGNPVLLPTWTPADVLLISYSLEREIAIHSCDCCNRLVSRTPDQISIQYHLPQRLACVQHDTNKSIAWHHNYWRTRLAKMGKPRCEIRDSSRDLRPTTLDSFFSHRNADGFQEYYFGVSLMRALGKEVAWEEFENSIEEEHCFHGRDSSSEAGSDDDDIPVNQIVRTSLPKKKLPRLVLLNTTEDILEEKGCTCFGAWTCCMNLERSGCDECVVCCKVLARKEAVTHRGLKEKGNKKEGAKECQAAFAVQAPFGWVFQPTSRFTRELELLRGLVVRCPTMSEFDLDSRGNRGRMYGDFEVERKAMEYVIRDWEVEILTHAVRKGGKVIEGIRRKINAWQACIAKCALIERAFLARREEMLSQSKRGLKRGMRGRKVVVDSDEEYEEDLRVYKEAVEGTRKEITREIEAFLGSELDLGGVRERMSWEVEEKKKKGWRYFGEDGVH